MAETFTITGQHPTQIIGGSGIVVPAMHVAFTTKPSGIDGSVDIPQSAYTPDTVATAVAAQSRILEDVAKL